jgi:putative transposase
MARIKRLIPQVGALHVMCRGNNKQIVFNGDSDKLRYYSLMLELKDENQVSIIHYCLMNNHVHLIFLLNSLCRISRFMQQLNLSYFIYYRDVYGYVGHLFQGRFKSKIIENNHYLLQCGKYVELNPVRGGLVKLPHEYKFSSYNYYAKGKPDSLLTENPFYLDISDRPDRRRKIYEEFVIDDNIIRGKMPKKGRPFKNKNNGDASLYFWRG